MDDEILSIDSESASVQTHLGILQNVIQRMSANSSSCKAWCVTLVAAILVIVADKGQPDYAWISLLPTVMFAALDAYYLALEKAFRISYNNFVSKVQRNNLAEDDLFFVEYRGDMSQLQINAFKSFSVWGFYLPLVLLMWLTKTIAIG